MDAPSVPSIPPPELDTSDVRARVLVVDDDRVGSKMVAAMIERLGHEVILAHEWTDALRVFKSQAIDLVFMDAVMPTVDGFKLTRIFRERSASYVPIVFVTGLTDQRARQRCVECGADDLLTKPVDEFELQIRLTAMLRIRRLTKALEEKSAMLAKMARVDALTGLLNRRALDERLPEEVARARRYDRPLCLLMLDVDHFKLVNDTRGHDAGDGILRGLGEIFRSTMRVTDGIFRYGGEEFVILAPDTDPSEAAILAERIRAAFQERSGETLSVGIACLSGLVEDADSEVLKLAADEALYVAKRGGRDQVALGSSPA